MSPLSAQDIEREQKDLQEALDSLHRVQAGTLRRISDITALLEKKQKTPIPPR